MEPDKGIISKTIRAEDTTRIIITTLSGKNDAGTNSVLLPASSVSNSSVPAKINLTGSHTSITADRGAIVLLTADIVDLKGNHVNTNNPVLKWTVTGPATLIGPSVYVSADTDEPGMSMETYKNLPVVNFIRSTGEPGLIRVRVYAAGLASAMVEIRAAEAQAGISGIIEPGLKNEGRKPVARPVLNRNSLEDPPNEIKMISQELKFNPATRSGLVLKIKEYILNNNPGIDTLTIEFKTLMDVLSMQMNNNGGYISAEDYNFNAEHYNNCKLIYSYISSTKLPSQFKEGLNRHYSEIIIRKGSERNAGEEMNWLNWIPSGGTVVMCNKGINGTDIKGVILTDKDDLADLIAIVYPQFANFSKEAKERALIFTGKINPFVHPEPGTASGKNGDSILSYKAEHGKTILIPLLKFISE